MAVLTTVVGVRGVRVGRVPRTRFGVTCEQALAEVFAALAERPEPPLFSVDAGIATVEQFRGATDRDALVGCLSRNITFRLDIHASNFAALALQGVAPRKYRKIEEVNHANDLQLPMAA